MQKGFFIWIFLSFLHTVQAQVSPSDRLSNDFNTYQGTNYQEKVFLHTDKSFYLTGENLFFKAYLVNSSNHQPSDLSKVIYVELLGEDSLVNLQSKISSPEASNGSFFLPTHLPTGKYVIRAYTRWMRNADVAFFFTKTIIVFNPFQAPPTPTLPKKQYDVQFFPEGGHLLESVKSKIAFRVVNETGKGIDFRGILLNAANDTLASFQPLKFGIGHFYFTPKEGNQYAAHLYDLEGTLIAKQALPLAQKKGYTLTLTERERDGLLLQVQRNFDETEGFWVVLMVHCRGKLIQTELRKITQQSTEIELKENQLGEGINHITLFDESGNPMAERLYFKSPENKGEIEIRSAQQEYTSRSKIQLDLQLPKNMDLDMSMAVYRLDELQASEELSIENYFLLSSDLKGNIESPAFYFETGDLVKEATDNLMLTHGWRRFEWKNVLSGLSHDIAFLPEYVAPIVAAEIINKKTKELGINIAAYFSLSGKEFIFRGARSNAQGKVFVEMQQVYRDKKLTLRLSPKDESLYEIKLMDSFAKRFYPKQYSPLLLTPEIRSQAEDRSVYMQSRRVFQKKAITKVASDSLHFYGQADETYYLDDYTRFPVMEEVMREYVQGVLVKRSAGTFQFRIFNLNTGRLFDLEPLILLDGVPFFEVDKIMELDPFLIKSIEVKRRKEFHGALNFYGIISYQSFEGDLAEQIMGARSSQFDYQGLQTQRSYFSPKYETEQARGSRLPDFRDLLYWNPNVQVQSPEQNRISFFSSDLTGTYEVFLNGLSKDGTLFHGRTRFEVK